MKIPRAPMLDAGPTDAVEAWKALCLKVLDEMTRDVAPTIASISRPIGADEGELVGTGTYVRLLDEPYILTNEHVARRQLVAGLAHLPKEGEWYHAIGSFQAEPPPIDAALARLHQNSLVHSDRACVPIARVAERLDIPDRELLFILGFPGKLSRMSGLAGGLVTRAVPYLTQRAPLPDGFDSTICFGLHYPADHVLLRTEGRPSTLPEPNGLSGSAVWSTQVVARKGENWSSDAAKIVGLVHKWDPSNHILVATKIEFIRGFALEALRKECAYFSWLQRGQPLGDEWRDWFAAEESIPFLR